LEFFGLKTTFTYRSLVSEVRMTEKKILALSQSVLKEKGYAATSVCDIAKALDMEPTSLYRHF
jgi:AcrR family transcriptional regulator